MVALEEKEGNHWVLETINVGTKSFSTQSDVCLNI